MGHTLYELYKKYRETHLLSYDGFFKTTFIKNPETGDYYNFEKNYLKDSIAIDNVIIRKYGSRIFPCPDYFNEDEKNMFLKDTERALSIFLYDASGVVQMLADNYERAYNIMMAEYEPLYNTDKHSVIEEKHIGDLLIKTGTETDTLSKSGSETDTLNINGTETDTFSKYGTETNTSTKNGTETDTLSKSGSETDTLTKSGSEKETTNKDAYSDTLKKSVSPDNSETFYNSEKNDNSYGLQKEETNTTFTNRSDTNTKTFNNRTDTNTKQIVNLIDENVSSFSADRKDENVKTFANRVDENVKTFANRVDENVKSFSDRKDSTNYTVTTKEDSKGNIGVKSSTELMLEEYKTRLSMNFYNQLFKEILFEITY